MPRPHAWLAQDSYDVLVIGGGIVGACAARDAARRGLKVALVERDGYGSGISSNSLKIVHGGLRSLQSLDFRQARHFVRERRAWLTIAPHLVDPLPFVVPTRGAGRESALLMRVGLALNEVVSRDRNEGVSSSRRIPHGHTLSRAELRTTLPGTFDGYAGGALFYDAQLYSAERLVYAVLSDAERSGAYAGSYTEAVAPLRVDGSLGGIVAQDKLTGDRFDVRARMIINAAGAGASAVADMLLGRERSVPPMAGIALNLMLEGDGRTAAFALATRAEGRMRRLFVVPWRGRTLVGTAHYECERAPQSRAELEPYVERFVREVAAAWPERKITRDSVLLVHSGMQPSPHQAATGPSEHLIVDHARDGVPELLSAVGPKLTTSRAVAEQLIDIVVSRTGGASKPCDTATALLESSPTEDMDAFVAKALASERSGLPEDVVMHLARWYGGSGLTDFVTSSVRTDPRLAERIEPGSPVIRAQLSCAAMMEGAATVDDIIYRHTELGATGYATARAREAARGALDHAASSRAAGASPQLPGVTPESRSR